MARCAGSKPDRTPCERIVKASQTYCYSHDPDHLEQRKRNASKAGRGGATEIRGLKKQIEDLVAGVLDGKVERANAAVCGQLLNVKLRAVETERKVKETEELEERIAALEEQPQQGGGRSWRGA